MKHSKGFTVVEVIVVLVVVAIIGALAYVGYGALQKENDTKKDDTTSKVAPAPTVDSLDKTLDDQKFDSLDTSEIDEVLE